MTVALAIIIVWLVLTTVVGVMAGINRRFGLEEYMVGGRSFGTLLFYTIAAAEIYSAFAFLGLAGWAFQKGLSISYGLAYMGIAYGLLDRVAQDGMRSVATSTISAVETMSLSASGSSSLPMRVTC